MLARADFISVHLPKTKETAGLINKDALAKTKPGVIIVNAARGGLIDETLWPTPSVAGMSRPRDSTSMRPNRAPTARCSICRRWLSPALGASTAEAQDRAGTDVAASVKLALAGEFVPDAVNVGAGVVSDEVAPWLELARKIGLLVGVLATEPPTTLTVRVSGELASEDAEVLKLSALRGYFSTVTDQQVTFVNAPMLAQERALSPNWSRSVRARTIAVIDVRVVGPDGSATNVSGTLSGPQQAEKVVQINGRNFDLRAEGQPDPALRGSAWRTGKIGTLLGAPMSTSRGSDESGRGGDAATVMLRLDRDVPADVRAAIGTAVGAVTLEVVDLS